MRDKIDSEQPCFLCRLMRGAGLTSVGALAAGYGALALGLPRVEAAWYAIGGGLGVFFLVNIIATQRGAASRREDDR